MSQETIERTGGASDQPYKWIGKSQLRREDFRLMTGKGMYVDDFREYNGQAVLIMAVVRSPYSHARITKIDMAAVRALPGVVAAYSGAELASDLATMPTFPVPDLKIPPRYPLATDVVRYVGDPLAIIVAESRAAANDAQDLLAENIEYEPLPAVAEAEAALEDGAPLLFEDFGSNAAFVFKSSGGDVAGAFAEADRVINLRVVNQRISPASMEPRAAFFNYDKTSGQMEAWLSTQAVFRARDTLARYLKLDPKNIRCHVADVGGGFGSKTGWMGEEIVAALMSYRLGRPVKWQESRSENLSSTTHGRGQINYIQAAVKNDGTLLGLKVNTVADLGAWLAGATPMVPTGTPRMLNGVYTLKGVATTVIGALNNRVPTSAYRGAGRPEAAYILERTIDRIATDLKLDPAEVRFRNFIPPESFPYPAITGVQYDSGNYTAALQKALDMLDYAKWREEQARRRALLESNDPQGRYQIGIGIATYIEIAGGGGASAPGIPQESATVKLNPDGTVLVQSGVAHNGQGHYTLFAQIAAEVLGVDMDKVEVVMGDTALPAYGIGTFGSRTTNVAGSAVYLAAEAVRDEVLKAAARMLEVAEVDLTISEGVISVRGVPGKGLTLAEVMEANAIDAETLFNQHRAFNPPGATFPSGAHIAVTEIDLETGDIQIIKYVAIDDCGRVINPILAAGQVHGGLAQGISQALYEELVYSEDGQLLSGTLMDYTMPTATEVPNFDTGHVESPSPLNPLGAKGVAEGGCTGGPPAVVNAALDALAPLGIREIDMPLRPEKIWALVQAARAGQLTASGGLTEHPQPAIFAKLEAEASAKKGEGGSYVFE